MSILLSRRGFASFLPVLIFVFTILSHAFAAEAPAAKKPEKAPPDVIVFTNGDKISGKFLREAGGQVAFHSDVLGDVTVSWDKIQELHTQTKLVVLQHGIPPRGHGRTNHIATGTLDVDNQQLMVHQDNGVVLEPVPVKKVQYIIDETTLHKQVATQPGFFAGWNGNLSAGATIVEATQEQYTFSGGVSLARVVPTVSWLDPRNRTTVDFTGSFGKIIQPAYASDGVLTPASTSKTSIYHADTERDEYFSTRFFALAQSVFDHNYGQNLDLQQIYGRSSTSRPPCNTSSRPSSAPPTERTRTLSVPPSTVLMHSSCRKASSSSSSFPIFRPTTIPMPTPRRKKTR
jgi:hypothetical protein